MTIAELLAAYRAGTRDPTDTAAAVIAACAAAPSAGASPWITRVADEDLLAAARRLDDGDRTLPLYGVPFAVKDNIDVAGLPTTAGLPAPLHVAERSATAVQRLLDAGALLVGKTNMDQLATGLVGTRSPYGACSSVFDARRISGGSSSGSAVAVAAGLVAFALGTDTAGSGRIPAAFNGIVGLKPTRGLISTAGVLPACASLDCVSVFAADAAGAAAVLQVAAAFDPQDPWSRPAQPPPAVPRRGLVGVPPAAQLTFSEPEADAAWHAAIAAAARCFDLVEVDVSALLDAAGLLYASWVAERTADLLAFVEEDRPGLDPTVASIIRGGADLPATAIFHAAHRLAELTRRATVVWTACDALLLPTASGHPTLTDVAAEPLAINSELGRYTNFVNLMDLCAVAIPGPTREDALPAGVTLMAPSAHDDRILELAARLTGEDQSALPPRRAGTTQLAAVGAHMGGLPLNGQLTERGGRFLRAAHTAPAYRLYALPSAAPPVRPGLVRSGDGASILLEVWELTPQALGELLALVPAPLALGTVALDDGSSVTGFVCEGDAITGAEDVTRFGGWRAYLASLRN